jgi:aminoglycoside phosphotransferase (APT) family kinase protein
MGNDGHIEISAALVRELLEMQFPHWAHLSVDPVKSMGFDNRTFRLGSEMSVRLPSEDIFSPQTQKENQWLPFLATNLSTEIPRILGVGKPSAKFPRPWSIRRWIEGQSINEMEKFNKDLLIHPLARFLNELNALNGMGGPTPGPHSGFRGGHLSVYDDEAKVTFSKLEDVIDITAARNIWKEALASQFEKSPVWVHGDINSGNLLMRDGQFAAVIDFGTMAVGDPACDLVMAWTFFKGESRKLFKQSLNRDAEMWARARGWALWKVLYTLAFNYQKTPEQSVQSTNLFAEILKD